MLATTSCINRLGMQHEVTCYTWWFLRGGAMARVTAAWWLLAALLDQSAIAAAPAI